jgi:hypothetical protein
MAETLLPKWQRSKKPSDATEAICHDCELGVVADMLVGSAYDALRGLDEPTDKQHITEVLLRAAMKTTWLTEEDHKELVNERERSARTEWAGALTRQVQLDSPHLNVQETAREVVRRMKEYDARDREEGSYDG